MLWNNAFIHTLREDPAEAELISHKLMIRSGMIQKLAAGIYDYLPLGLRVIRKIEAIIRAQMAACGAAELLMPAVVPAELWKESGRWNYYGPELLRFTDRKSNEFCLGPTHEEVVVDVARRAVRSYRDLPLSLYQIQSKFRDEVRPRYGLMRGREFIMKDAYSFHADEASLEEMYWRMHAAYTTIFNQCGLKFRPVEADSGTIGGDVTHEFHVLADSGEDTIAYCDHCDYAANIERAAARQSTAAPVSLDCPLPEEVATPGKKTIEEVCAFLGIAPTQAIKMLIYEINDAKDLVAVCIRGDLAINEAKLRGLTGANQLVIPDDQALRARTGLCIGYLGAYSFDRSKVTRIIADYSVRGMTDCVCGANRDNAHCRHISPLRDLTIDTWADLGFVAAGEGCPRCDQGALRLCKGIEVGQVFKLGQKYAKPMNMSFLDEKGDHRIVTMGCYGIGVGRTAAAAIEQNHDKDGIVWPIAIAPFQVVVACLDPANPDVRRVSVQLHDELVGHGIDVVLDDRDERPGIKFKDADLVGFPLRVIVGSRGLAKGIVEIKPRRRKESEEVDVAQCYRKIVALLADQTATG
jgi:prolyl-tRNA synthetase